MKMKKMMMATLALVAGISLAACASSEKKDADALDTIKEKGTLVVATSPDYAPFEFQTLVDGKNQVVGADMLLAQKIADELGVELKISPMNFDNVLNSVQTGKADLAIAGLSYSDERAEVFDFTDSYYEIEDVLLVKKSDQDAYTDMSSLKGKTIAVQKGTTQETYVKEKLSDAKSVSLTVMGEAVNELKNGQVDAVLLDSAVAEGYVSQNSDLTIASIQFEKHESNQKVIALAKGNKKLQKAVNAVIKDVVENGDYQTYLEESSKYTVSE